MANCMIFCCFVCVFFIPFVLQGVGFFTPNWTTNGNCTKVGLFYRCCGNGTGECQTDNADTYMNTPALALQATSFVILLLTVLSLGWTVCCTDGDDNDDGGSTACLCCAVCSMLMYPIAGLLILIGCILVAVDYPTSSLGFSFYLAIVAGCIILLLVIMMCCLVCMQNSDDDSTTGYGQGSEMTVSSTHSSGLPVRSGGSYVAGEVISHEESGISGGMAFVRRIQVVRIMRLSHMIE